MEQKQFLEAIGKHYGFSITQMARSIKRSQQSLERTLKNQDITYKHFTDIYLFVTGEVFKTNIEDDAINILKEISKFKLVEVIKGYEDHGEKIEVTLEKITIQLTQSKL